MDNKTCISLRVFIPLGAMLGRSVEERQTMFDDASALCYRVVETASQYAIRSPFCGFNAHTMHWWFEGEKPGNDLTTFTWLASDMLEVFRTSLSSCESDFGEIGFSFHPRGETIEDNR